MHKRIFSCVAGLLLITPLGLADSASAQTSSGNSQTERTQQQQQQQHQQPSSSGTATQMNRSGGQQQQQSSPTSSSSSGATSMAQGTAGRQKPPLSPPAMTEATIGGKKITIKYSAPLTRGRKIMGELVPYGKVWRTGANAATSLTTDGDLTIGTLQIPKGSYTLYTLPGETSWKLIVNKQTGQPGTTYEEAQDLGRVDLSVKQTSAPVEKFLIELTPSGANAGLLKMTWENTELSVPVTVAQ